MGTVGRTVSELIQCIDDSESGEVLELRIDSSQTPAPWLNSFRQKVESDLLIYTKSAL